MEPAGRDCPLCLPVAARRAPGSSLPDRLARREATGSDQEHRRRDLTRSAERPLEVGQGKLAGNLPTVHLRKSIGYTLQTVRGIGGICVTVPNLSQAGASVWTSKLP